MREAAAGKVHGCTYRLPQLPDLADITDLTDLMKTIWKSKTFWLQVVTLASALVPQVQTFIVANPVEFAAVLAAVNTLMRFATSGKVSLVGAGEE